jgi:hypothetical protein
MSRIPSAVAQILIALGSVALFRGSSCSFALCIEDCDPCVSQCQCHHTCQHPNSRAFEPAHRLVAFELLQSAGEDGATHQTFAWIGGLSVARATGRDECTPRDLREFAEGVLGVNHELLDLDPSRGHWEFGSVELAGEFALVAFTRVDAGGRAAEGALEFVFDAHGKLLEIDRTLPGS